MASARIGPNPDCRRLKSGLKGRHGIALDRREAIKAVLSNFAFVYLGVVLVTLIIAGLVGNNLDIKYPHIQSPYLQFRYQVPLSKIAKPSKAYSDKMGILVAADRIQNVYVNYRIITINELRLLVKHNRTFGSGRVYIKADHALSYGFVRTIMNECANSGAREIRILLEDRPYYDY